MILSFIFTRLFALSSKLQKSMFQSIKVSFIRIPNRLVGQNSIVQHPQFHIIYLDSFIAFLDAMQTLLLVRIVV